MNLLKTLKPFASDKKESRVAMCSVVRQGQTHIATNGASMAVVGPKAASGPVVNVETGEEVPNYPNWQRVYPAEVQLFMRVERRQLLAIAQAFLAAAKGLLEKKKQLDDTIAFEVQNGRLFAHWQGAFEMKASAWCESHPCAIAEGSAFAFGAGHLVRVLSAMESYMVDIYCQPTSGGFYAEARAMVFVPHNEDLHEGLRIILMPVKLRES